MEKGKSFSSHFNIHSLFIKNDLMMRKSLSENWRQKCENRCHTITKIYQHRSKLRNNRNFNTISKFLVYERRKNFWIRFGILWINFIKKFVIFFFINLRKFCWIRKLNKFLRNTSGDAEVSWGLRIIKFKNLMLLKLDFSPTPTKHHQRQHSVICLRFQFTF